MVADEAAPWLAEAPSPVSSWGRLRWLSAPAYPELLHPLDLSTFWCPHIRILGVRPSDLSGRSAELGFVRTRILSSPQILLQPPKSPHCHVCCWGHEA